MPSIRIALCQLNTVVGDISGNVERIKEALERANDGGADIALFPELTITGYPPEDLLLKSAFVQDSQKALDEIVKATRNCVAIVGYVSREGRQLFNSAAVCHHGFLVGKYDKRMLPNYGPFDERRYFEPGSAAPSLFAINGLRVGVTICEDAWYVDGPMSQQASGGAELIVNLNASPFYAGRLAQRRTMLAERVVETGVPIAYVNQVGGQDELVFDGGSMVIDASGRVVANAVQFSEETLFVDVDVAHRHVDGDLVVLPTKPALQAPSEPSIPLIKAETLSDMEEVYSALVLGTRDYITKNGFSDVVVGLSGGIDSSLVATIAVDAIGSNNVHGVLMPSRYSSDGSITDARLLASRLDIETLTMPIEAAHSAFHQMFDEAMEGSVSGLTDENLQSRIRGVMLMALSNRFGWLVLTTGNKSELAVGYSTLYGDTAGGFAVIKDVFKTEVYELCKWRNSVADSQVIPESVISKPPSAELRPDQRDDQSLPSYEVLDAILEAYVEHDQSAIEIDALGFDPDVVKRIVRLVDLAEYKRRQSPIGVRVTPKAFGKDRRVPITNRYSG